MLLNTDNNTHAKHTLDNDTHADDMLNNSTHAGNILAPHHTIEPEPDTSLAHKRPLASNSWD